MHHGTGLITILAISCEFFAFDGPANRLFKATIQSMIYRARRRNPECHFGEARGTLQELSGEALPRPNDWMVEKTGRSVFQTEK